MKESQEIQISFPHIYLYKRILSRIYIIIYVGKGSAGIFVINLCQSTLTLAKFMNFVLHMVKKEREIWLFPKSDESRY